ncbi:hypothetical protein HZC30_00600 [Candidatus Woesearchaeota archaeon]|nr:hypothetical protein [Candidatus Woesearchaeota archaeon]
MEMKLQIPDAIGREMKKDQFTNWNEIIVRELFLKVSERQLVEEILKKSKLTEENAEEIGEKIKENLYREHYLAGAHS